MFIERTLHYQTLNYSLFLSMNQPTSNIKLHVEGMTCANCANTVSSYLKKEGLQKISVSFADNEVIFEDVVPEKLQQIKKGIVRLGYKVVDNTSAGKKSFFSLENIFAVCVVLTIPLLLHMFMPYHLLHNQYFQLALAVPVFILGWYYFGRSAIGSLRAGAPNMDVLILLGASAAFFYSLGGTIFNLGSDFIYYETAATIITLVMLGNLIEKKTVKQTTTSIDNLSRLKPDKATLIIDVNGFEMPDKVNAEKIKIGDTIRVNTGDRVPLDGKVISGNGFTDESMITGESIPVEKYPGDYVTSGTLLQQGSLKVSVTATAGDSYISKLIELVKTAHSQKPDIQRFADQVSNYFVPMVIGISLMTFLVSHFAFDISATTALINSIAVLVIACPCAMGLATPTAIMVGLGRVAGKGILFKGAKTVEQLAKIKTVVFDKTGTLTTGIFRISLIKMFSNESAETAKSIIYTLEKHSSHPIANSIVRELQGTDSFSFNHVEEEKGKGVKGVDNSGNIYWFGSAKLLKQNDMGYDLYLLKNDELIAALDIEDDIKQEAKEVVAFLKSKNIKVILLSGDSRKKCEHVARKTGISSIYAEVSPEKKLKLISDFSAQSPTAMVGDGINDAPALAKATIGISLSDASEVAIDSAQIILLKGNLIALKEAILISRYTFATIKQNLFWALSYNFIAIPIAAAGFLNPMIAALSMAFSDVVVIGNSLLLKWKKIR
jgi:P-type Cu+ transporter